MWDELVTGFNSIVDSYSNSGIVSDAVNGALFGAISTAVGGGDILKGAAWGAAGNAISGAGDEGIFNVIGKGVAGYGIDKAVGGDGLLGGAGGLLAGYLEGGEEVTRTADNKTESTAETADISDGAEAKETQGLLEKYGLQTEKGDGTLLGKSLVSAIGAYGSSIEAEDQLEKAAEIRAESDRNAKLLDEEFQQRNLAGFKQPRMVVRNT